MMNEDQHQQLHQSGFMIATGTQELVTILENLPDDDEDGPTIAAALAMIGMALDRLHTVVERHHKVMEAEEAEAKPQPEQISKEDADKIMAEFNAGIDDFLSSLPSADE